VATISQALREQVIAHAGGRCEYCRTLQAIVVEMEVDHIAPESAGGATNLDNLSLSCVGCNGFKLAFQSAVDPETGEEASLFNPPQPTMDRAFRLERGRHTHHGPDARRPCHHRPLRMNRERVVEARRLWVEAGWHPPR
jgi:hypothetical protein